MDRDIPFLPPMDVNVYHHDVDTKRLINRLTKKVEKIMATMQELRDSVRRNTEVDESVVTLIQGISQQLKDAQASNDPAAIDEVITQLDANTKRMADAVAANTQEKPKPEPTPV